MWLVTLLSILSLSLSFPYLFSLFKPVFSYFKKDIQLRTKKNKKSIKKKKNMIEHSIQNTISLPVEDFSPFILFMQKFNFFFADSGVFPNPPQNEDPLGPAPDGPRPRPL